MISMGSGLELTDPRPIFDPDPSSYVPLEVLDAESVEAVLWGIGTSIGNGLPEEVDETVLGEGDWTCCR